MLEFKNTIENTEHARYANQIGGVEKNIANIVAKNKRQKTKESLIAKHYSFMSNAACLDTAATSRKFQSARIVRTKRGKKASDKARKRKLTRKAKRAQKKDEADKEYDKDKKRRFDQKAAGMEDVTDENEGNKNIYRPPILPD